MRAACGCALLAGVLLVPVAHAPVPADAPPAERPTYTVGDRWIRTDGAYDLVRIENDRYVFTAGSGPWASEPPAKLEMKGEFEGPLPLAKVKASK